MTRRNLVCLMAALALCLCSLPAAAKQPRSYRLALVASLFVDLERGGQNLTIGGLNDKGEVAVYEEDFNQFRSYVWHEGEIQEVGSAILRGINDRSVVSGEFRGGPGAEGAFFWHDGDMFFLQAATGERLLFATDINNRRQAIVSYVAGQSIGPALWRRGEITKLDPPPGFSGSSARRLNNHGVVVGAVGSPGTNSFPAMWQDGTVMQIALPPGAIGGAAGDINDRGTVVANADFDGQPFGHTIAYLWKDGEITLLPPLTSEHQTSGVGSINNHDIVVGASTTIPGRTFLADATIWRRGRATNLNDLICDQDPLKPFVHLSGAEQINNPGQIVARGRDSRLSSAFINYYLLTPDRCGEGAPP
ncbi:MAG TPA: hypothetical protein VJS12_24230 [Steroidobacteraceae bacterium]|nr:hypothetical protein [Steroidobacteraceae bacterium]